MRARTEATYLREPLLWLVAAVWLSAGQLVGAQAPDGAPAPGGLDRRRRGPSPGPMTRRGTSIREHP